MTSQQRIKIARELIESDAGFEADCVVLDKSIGREVSQREIDLAELVSRLYILFHPTGDCPNPHSDWEEENEKLIA